MAETIYLKCPIVLQTFALYLYGFRLKHIRYGAKYNTYYQQALNRLNYTQEQMQRYALHALKSIVNDCAKDVPFYRRTFKQIGFQAGDLKDFQCLNKLPLLSKQSIQENPDDFLSERYKRRNLLTVNTTGTTGTPLRVYCTKEVRQMNYAYYDCFLQSCGFNINGKRATMGGRVVVHPEQKSPPFWRHIRSLRNLLLSSYHLTDENMLHYIAKLRGFGADYVDAYPSSLFALANFALQRGIELKGITKGITTSSETLFDDQRAVIETAFGVPIYDQYGAAEMCVFIAQCKNGSYHIRSDYAYVEFVRNDGTAARPGESGEIVCTGLINPVMPLIRYRMGDRALISDRMCECGAPFPVIEHILGRMDDVIITPNGRRVGRLSPVLKGFPVKEAQYLQSSVESVEVIFVPNDGYCEAMDRLVVKELRKRLGNEIRIVLTKVPHLRRSRGGKLRSVISYVKQ